ncbi:hypothetical protein GCM10028784_32960 [Myceligenerans cantabricum]
MTTVGLVALAVVGELALRSVIDDRIEAAAADMPAGVTVTRDETPALWQVATGQARLRVEVSPEAMTDLARSATELEELQVTSEQGRLVAQVPLPVGGQEQTVDLLLSVAAEDDRAVLRADTVRFGGLSLPLAELAGMIDNPRLDRLSDGVTFPQDEGRVAISSARATADGLELGAEVAIW